MAHPKIVRNIHPEVSNDILDLPDAENRLLALQTIKAIVAGKTVGSPLENRKSTADLSDCMKVLFDTRRDIPPRFRIVYRKSNKGVEIFLIEVLAVGERFGLEAYLSAALRLNRSKG